ncbi:MAG TPA: hypothetical protein VK875_08740 [Euzebyales bacterium]|nr:hypothetical protein [Euzebyales bacterium]
MATAAAPRARRSKEALVLLSCGANALITTVHHVRGALLYGTPNRYHAVLLAAAMLAATITAYGVSRTSSRTGRVSRIAWWVFWAGSLIGFVVLFGLFEGLVTHVIAPIAQGYSPDEPFDLPFEVTGVLHVVPAVVTAVLLARLFRQRRDAAPRAAHGPHGAGAGTV